MQGGIMDGLAHVLTSSLHLQDGAFLEGSWDNYFYTRQWNVAAGGGGASSCPRTPTSRAAPASSGWPPPVAAVACAYARATGTMPTSFPINHTKPLGFDPEAPVPPVPESPTDGLDHTLLNGDARCPTTHSS